MRGFTLVELLVTVFIFAMIFAATFAVLTVGNNSWYTGNEQVQVSQEVRKALLTMDRELRQSRSSVISDVFADGAYYDAITFRVPEDTDDDGDVIDAAGNVEWSDQINYSRNAENQIIRTTAAGTSILANDISNLQFRRPSGSPSIVEMYLTSQRSTAMGRQLSANIMSSVKMRN